MYFSSNPIWKKKFNYGKMGAGFRRPRRGYAAAVGAGVGAYVLAKKAYKAAKYVKSLVNVEFKHHEPSFTGTVPSTGNVTLLTEIGTGDTNITRDGESVRLKSLQLRGTYAIDPTTATNQKVRMLVIRWNDDSTPTIGNILQGGLVNDFYNLDETNKFKVLVDKYFTVNTVDRPQKDFVIKLKLNDICKWKSSTGSDVQTGHFYLVDLSDQATNPPTASWQGRLRYIDN